MPKVQSSSKGGTKLVLFANEERYMRETQIALLWCAKHTEDKTLEKLGSDTCDNIQLFLKLLNESPKPTDQAGGK